MHKCKKIYKKVSELKKNEVILNENNDYVTFGLDQKNNEDIIKAQKEMNKNKTKK